MKTFLVSLILIVVYICSYAQPSEDKCKIIGRIVDSTNKTPVEYAAVSLFGNGKTDVAGGMITDDKGQFIIENIEAGVYKLKIDFIGFKTRVIENITLKQGENKLGDIIISGKSRTMKEVTITGTKSFVENKLDKLVFNVGNDITSDGGTATDVLKKVPQVSVDADGNVELLGNSNIKVLLNGKPSAQFDNNLTEALRVIPASQIEKIEVITSPGAQYDAEGTGGIINIILKETKVQGINGNINLAGGTKFQSGSLYLHAQKNHVEFNLSISGNYTIPGTTITSLNRKSDSAGIPQTLLVQNGTGASHWQGYRGQLGMDWEISKNNHFSATVGYFSHGMNTVSLTNQVQTTYLPTEYDLSTIRNVNNGSEWGFYDISLSYKHNFKKEGQELSLYLKPSYTFDNTIFNQNQHYQTNNDLFSGAKGNNNLKEYETYATADYAHPFSKEVVLNVGAKSTITRINSYSDHYALAISSGDYILDPYLIDYFNYSRDIYAIYASMTFPLHKDYNLKLGIRDEYTMFYKTLATDSIIPAYNTIAPSAVISRNITKTQTLKLSYAYRIQRPGSWELNPFIDATDPLNIQQGNPALVPEKVHNLDLSYFHSFEKGSSFLVMLYYRYSTEDEQNYIFFKPTLQVGDSVYKNVSIQTRVNAGTQYVTGVNISGTLKLFDEKLEMRGNLTVSNKYIVSDIVAGATAQSLNYRLNLNFSYKITKTLIVECFGNFRSASTEIQGTFPAWSSYSMAIRKTFWDKNGSLAFTTTNPFTPNIDFATNVAGQNFSINSLRRLPYQSFGLSFTYKFGKLEFKDNKQEGGGDMGGGGEDMK